MGISKNVIFTYFLIWTLLWIWCYNVLEDIVLTGLILLLTIIFVFILCLIYRHFLIVSIYCFIWVAFWLSIWNLNYEKLSENIDRVYVYSGLYNSYQWEVHSVYKRSDFYDEYIVELDKINDTEFSDKIAHVLRVPKNFVLQPRQAISYNGVMYLFEDFDGFQYKKYMLSRNLYFSTSTNTIHHIYHDITHLSYKISILREWLLSTIAEIFPQREAIFLWGILFGARENIPQDLKKDFNNSWLTHFIAVSWFNITLCIIFMSFLLWFLPMYIRVVWVIGSIVLFSFFVWLWAPVVRAAIMWSLAYLFLQSWNKSHTLTLIAFTATVMSILSPLSLNYDVSLHLSFLAVIGIIYTQELFTKLFSWIPSTFAIREAFVLTLSALSFSLPIMMFQFGQVSLLAPFANIAVTWTIPLAMLWWAITLILDSISPVLWQGAWFITWILLRYDMAMVEFFWNIDWALMQFDFWVYANYIQALYFVWLTYCLILYNLRKTS